MDYSSLEELGLSNAEAKVYVALLEQGSSATGNIIGKTKMQSSTVYHTLETLLKKGLVSFVFKGKIKYYQAEKPEVLLMFLEEKKQKFQEILPELKQKEKEAAEHYSAKVFEGMKGLKAAYNDVLDSMKKGETYYFIQIPTEKLMQEKTILFFRQYHSKRAEKGIIVKGICPYGDSEALKKIYSGLKHTELRTASETIPTSMVIYANKIMILDMQEMPVAFVIESKTVFEIYRGFAEKQWAKAKPLKL